MCTKIELVAQLQPYCSWNNHANHSYLCPVSPFQHYILSTDRSARFGRCVGGRFPCLFSLHCCLLCSCSHWLTDGRRSCFRFAFSGSAVRFPGRFQLYNLSDWLIKIIILIISQTTRIQWEQQLILQKNQPNADAVGYTQPTFTLSVFILITAQIVPVRFPTLKVSFYLTAFSLQVMSYSAS